MAYSSSINLSNIKENWLFKLGYDHSSSDGQGDGSFSQVLQANGSVNLVDDSGGFSDTATSFTVDDGDVFNVGDHIKIDNEILLITKKSGDLIFISRARLGTSANSHNDNSTIFWNNFLALSFSDVVYEDYFYTGAITNSPSIRETINLKNSTSKTSNMYIEIPDFMYNDYLISKELFGGTNNYINQTVLIYCKINEDTPTQIGSYRVTNISTDGFKIKITMASHQPWDFITFPQDTTLTSKVYVPYVAGDYTPNDSFENTPAFCDTKLYPVPSLGVDEKVIRTLMPREYGSLSNSHINIFQGGDVFLPLMSSTGAENDTTKTIENQNCLETLTSRLAVGKVFAHESRNPAGTGTEFTNTHLAFDKDINTASTASVTSANNYLLGFTSVSEKWSTHSIRVVRIRAKYSTSGTFDFNIFDESTNRGTVNVTFSADTYQAQDITLTYSSNNDIKVGTQWTIVANKTSGSNGTLSIGSVKLTIYTAFDSSDKDELKRLGDEKFWYSGGNGVKDAWSDTSAITKIHETHRDLLVRFTNFSTSAPEGWGNGTNDNLLDHAKDWRIRYWELEPVSLKSKLEKLQYEGGFIFRYRFDGSGQYVFIKDSYSSTDVTLSKEDISKVTLSPSPLSELLTKQVIKYRKHPARSSYLTEVECSNSTSRAKWNIQSKENISNVSLDAYVGRDDGSGGETDIPTSPSSNPNDDFYTYYDNIFGDIKLIISCDIINPAKWVTANDTSNPLNPLEVGSVIDFDNTNMFPESPMGYNSSSWSGIKFMITSMTRKLGLISIKAREIAKD